MKKELTSLFRVGLTLVEYAIAILVVAVSTQLLFGNNEQSWIITGLSMALMVFTTIIWTPQGIEKGEMTPKVFNTTLRYNTRANYIINNQMFEQLREFCKIRNEQYAKEQITHILGEKLIKYEELTNYSTLRQNALKTAIIKSNGKVKKWTDKDFIDFRSKYTKQQLKLLEKYSTGEYKFKHIKSDDLIKGHKASDNLVPNNTEKLVLSGRLVYKILYGVILGIFTASFVFTRKVWTINETIQVVLWGYSIAMNIYTSISSGYNAVVKNRFEYFKEKNLRCAEFFAYCGINIEAVEKGLDAKLIGEKVKG